MNHSKRQCGVYQYGAQLAAASKKLPDYAVDYIECIGPGCIESYLKKEKYWGVVYNYHPEELAFVTPAWLKQYPEPWHVCLAHELTTEIAHRLDEEDFDYYLFGDPTFICNNPRVINIGRLLPSYENRFALPDSPTIGSIGFASRVRKFENLVKQVQREFDVATIRLQIPANALVDPEGIAATACARHCQRLIYKPGITLQVSHSFLEPHELLDFLAQNTINLFCYDELGLVGISSAVDQGIAAGRPVAISDCFFFRHLFHLTPSILLKSSIFDRWLQMLNALCRVMITRRKRILFNRYVPSLRSLCQAIFKTGYSLKRRSLQEIIQAGFAPLEPLRLEWSQERFVQRLSNAFAQIDASARKGKKHEHS